MCQVFGISILSLVMFGFVSIADVFLVSFFIHLLNLSASYHLICQLRTHQQNHVSCELFHPAAARFA